ncbi:diaminopimelate epimerase [Mangrovibacillus cuniculi]|uniref:Diaminopimelate epimerase n=2 Tax=Mangrovibacillus cuniculi TaxID=2593652 RepID=A0A7S8CE96_9BACI|nr:diaminopimelate epimerase [Mangrovibacillus cuniculi]
MYGPYIKCHGSKNDFFIVDERKYSIKWNENQRKEAALTLCDRTHSYGGADGILFVTESTVADAKYRVINADGSEASMCGNGLRCVARYVCEELGKESVVIETMKANLTCRKHEDISEGVETYGVEISPIVFDNDALPFNYKPSPFIQQPIDKLSKNLLFSAVAVPNPHLITFVDQEELNSNLQKEISEYVNGQNPLFPDGVNVSFVRVLSNNKLFVRTYERGVGFTNACGTAMSATVFVATVAKKVVPNTPITVITDKGMVQCLAHTSENPWVELIGNATFTSKGQWTYEEGKWEINQATSCEFDIKQYDNLEKKAAVLNIG